MDILEILDKKRTNQKLTKEEINYFVDGYVKGSIADYQASAMTMAICINGLKDEETIYLTDAMIRSGDIMDLSKIKGIKVDKHSTGGVSDTTSIALVPLLACEGLKVAKMSGRGLGHTGGTLDKLEVFTGIKLEQPQDKIIDIVNQVGCVILSQTANLVPADKKLYALRDVTSTVQSIPLIASSVMSKKIASNNDVIVLDIKVGEGAFMKTLEDARHLASLCITIGKAYNKKVSAVITDMNTPLGKSVGCELETNDAINLLKGQKSNLSDIVFVLFKQILKLANINCDYQAEFDRLIQSGEGLQKLKEMVVALNGSTDFFDKELKPAYVYRAKNDGYIYDIKPKELGILVNNLGGGRKNIQDTIDLSVGIRLIKQKGDKVTKGEIIAELYSIQEKDLNNTYKELDNIILLSDTKPTLAPLILDIIE